MSITIETRIPLPMAAGGRVPKYPWRQMKVGDSFAVPADMPDHKGPQVASARRATGFTFTRRKTIEGTPPQPTWRVWRTA